LFSRVRDGFIAGYGRLKTSVWPVVQAAVAASLAYFLAEVIIGRGQPFFAPIAAVICLSVTLGRRNRRAVEIVFGVAVGLTVADLLVLVIGNGTLQLAVIVLLAMATAVFFGGGTLLVNQAAVSAVLVVVLQPPMRSSHRTASWARSSAAGWRSRSTTSSPSTPSAWSRGP
jgi:uncharacterized membrane protein YgaE (UPF0421/DUF939 family)